MVQSTLVSIILLYRMSLIHYTSQVYFTFSPAFTMSLFSITLFSTYACNKKGQKLFWLETKTFNMTFCASSYNKNYSSFCKIGSD